MKIQLKRSSVLDGGAAKEPTAAQMEYGELAVNYNESDPAIFLKDSNNNIIRISGIGNISDDGQVEVPSSNAPPVNPEAGNLWYNSEDGRLYVYYTDANSSQWVDASPDAYNPSEFPDLSDPSNQPGTLDDRYINKTGDDMTGDLTLGTDKITLDATNGSATFAGQVNSGGPWPSNGTTAIGVDGYGYIGTGIASTCFSIYPSNGVNRTIGFQTNGNAQFTGDITANNVSFNLEPDNPANYTTTTDAEGNETQVYNGPTLDVKDRLTKTATALTALKAAAADSSTTLEELKSAFVVALADF
jgi:hypothetical protein